MFLPYVEFDLERRWMWDYVLPELQSYFLSEGLDVLLVDVQQGCAVDHALDGRAFSRHLNLLADCHRTSVGPFSIVSTFTFRTIVLFNQYNHV